MIDRLETLVLEAHRELWPSGLTASSRYSLGTSRIPGVLRFFGSENFAGP